MSLMSVAASRGEWGAEPQGDPLSGAYDSLIREVGEDPDRGGCVTHHSVRPRPGGT
jgi:hypothetical protein